MIERESPKNVDKILKVINTSNREVFKNIIPKKYFMDPILSPKQLLKEFERAEFFSYKWKGRIVGVIALEVERGEIGKINWLYVLPPFQRRGIGTILVTYLEEQAKKSGLKKIQLVTIEKAVNAVNFYKKLGYQSVDYVKRQWGIDVCMEKKL